MENGLVYWFWQPSEGGGSNAFGPFVNRNHFAGWMLMATSVGLGYWLGLLERAEDVNPRWRNPLVWFSSRDASVLFLTATAIMLMAISIVWTMSRSGTPPASRLRSSALPG